MYLTEQNEQVTSTRGDKTGGRNAPVDKSDMSMSSRSNTSDRVLTEFLIQALKDESLAALIGEIFEKKLTEILSTLKWFEQENVVLKDSTDSLKQDNNNLKQELTSAFVKIDSLEAHDRKANLIITDLPVASYAKAASSQPQENDETVPIMQTEEAVLELCN